jgi:GTP-binding protein
LDTAQLEFKIPSRGLIGFRAEFLTNTKGAGIANALAAGYEPRAGEIVTRLNGSLIAYRAGVATPFAVIALQERGSFFVSPTSKVYAGMVVGENSRSEDMEVNITKEKQLTNMRAASADNFVGLTPQKKLSLEECLEFAREDECVEVTPEATRIRKLELDANLRARAASARKNASKTS